VIEAAHTDALGVRGMSQKTTDFWAIPLCFWHHRESLDSYHRVAEKEFARQHRIELKEVVRASLYRFWRQNVASGDHRPVIMDKSLAGGAISGDGATRPESNSYVEETNWSFSRWR
jgi:hypothetical protein